MELINLLRLCALLTDTVRSSSKSLLTSHRLALAVDNLKRAEKAAALGQIEEVGPPPETFWATEIKLREQEELARDEVASGFSSIAALGDIRLWSILEAGVDDFVGELAACDIEALSRNVPNVQVPVAALRAPPDELSETLVSAIKDKLGVRQQSGVKRFEPLLRAVSLSGDVHTEIDRALKELAQLRHVLVHRSGRADTRLQTNCPWFPCTLGEPVVISLSRMTMHAHACYWYLKEIDHRLARLAGVEPENLAIHRFALKQVMDLRAKCERSAE